LFELYVGINITMSAFCNVLLITGIPGIGKTTVIKKVVSSLTGLNIQGFYTEEIRINTMRHGFNLVTFQGERYLMAHVDSASAYRVGKYGVDVAAIDRVLTLTLSEDCNPDLYIIDEIGKMECFSGLFVTRISALIDSGKPVVATIALKGGGFISAVKNRQGVELWEVTKKNRDVLPGRIVSWARGNSHT
jgi:nucleoside-triphosphatase